MCGREGPRSPPPMKCSICIPSAAGLRVPARTIQPQVAAPYGAWKKTENRQFQITFVAFTFDRATGQTTGRLKVQARATLSEDAETLSGPARVSIYSTSGSLIVQVPTSFDGTRIAVEPL